MKTVLVVDDEYGIVEVVIVALEDEGYRVLAASDGQQALERLAEAHPDLVLLDFMMPRLDGPALAKAIRADPAHRKTPIIMMSAVGEAIVHERFSDYAAFLRKPFRVRAMLEEVKRLIGPGAEEGGL